MKPKTTSVILLFAVSLMFVYGCRDKGNEAALANYSKSLKVVTGLPVIDSSGMESYYIGTAEASVEVPVSFPTQGTVEKVFVTEGQTVSRGQTIASLVSASYKNILEMAEAQEKQASDAFNRLSKVYKDGSLPDIKYVEIETKLQQAVSATQIARKNYNDCILKAPANGVVGRKTLEPGTNVIPANPVLTLFQIDDVYINIPVPENEIPGIKKGEKATLRVAALNNNEYGGIVKEIGVIADQVSHTYDVKILVHNKGKAIKPGMACNVYIGKNVEEEVLAVPYSAVVIDKGQQYVYILNQDNKTVRKQRVLPGNYRNNNIVVRSGLNVNDRIIISGQHYLYDNAPVEVSK